VTSYDLTIFQVNPNWWCVDICQIDLNCLIQCCFHRPNLDCFVSSTHKE
jgi:hypothetical protein